MHKIEKSEIVEVAKIFAENIKDINIHKYFFPDPVQYHESMELLYLFYTNYHFDNVFVSDDLKCASIVHPPHKKFKIPSIKDAYSNFTYLTSIGIKAMSRLVSYQYWMASFRDIVTKEPNYYLDIFALKGSYNLQVSEKENFKKCDSSDDILINIINKANSENYKVFTETYNPDNIKFFEDYGFKVVKENVVPQISLTQYNLTT